ncbi:MAG: tRNA (pseudouridine(54)-N(1))-methyltransferase TrmY [Polyangiaceae bacterium]|jgi:tRNA (pseudouridine54-N1)-methyltransferase
MRRFAVIGQNAFASPDFSLDDLPATSGRLDVLLRCVRAAMLVSHGIRRDVTTYLILRGGQSGPRVVRIDGGSVRFLRPDERSLGTLVKKTLARESSEAVFRDVQPGIAMALGDIDVVLGDGPCANVFLLEEGAPDVREEPRLGAADILVFVGDHRGVDEASRGRLMAVGAHAVAVGPTSIHAEDAIAVLSNELDRRDRAT